MEVTNPAGFIAIGGIVAAYLAAGLFVKKDPRLGSTVRKPPILHWAWPKTVWNRITKAI